MSQTHKWGAGARVDGVDTGGGAQLCSAEYAPGGVSAVGQPDEGDGLLGRNDARDFAVRLWYGRGLVEKCGFLSEDV